MKYLNLDTIESINNQPSNYKTNEFVDFWIWSSIDEFKNKYDKNQFNIWCKVVQELPEIFDQQSLWSFPEHDIGSTKYLYHLIGSKKHNKNIFKIIADKYIELYLDYENKEWRKKEAINKIESVVKNETKKAIEYLFSWIWWDQTELILDTEDDVDNWINWIKTWVIGEIWESLIKEENITWIINKQIFIETLNYIDLKWLKNNQIILFKNWNNATTQEIELLLQA